MKFIDTFVQSEMFKFKLIKHKVVLTEICYDEENMQRVCNYKQVTDDKYLVEVSTGKRKHFKQKEFTDRFSVRLGQT